MNKQAMKLDLSDRMLRYGNPVGMEDGVKEIIIRQCGFELHNTRPYHNYETWSDGYIVIWRKDGKTIAWKDIGEVIEHRHDKEYGVASAEDLDEAVMKYLIASERMQRYQQAEANLSKAFRKYRKTEKKVEEGLFGKSS